MEEISSEVEKAHRQAVMAMNRAYAPYSGLRVACALKVKGHPDCVVGVNVENASYGGTLCAERSALVSMVSQMGQQEVEFAVVISSLEGEPIPPCGLCLQVMHELMPRTCTIYLGDAQGLKKSHQLKEFLPLAFSKDMLPD